MQLQQRRRPPWGTVLQAVLLVLNLRVLAWTLQHGGWTDGPTDIRTPGLQQLGSARDLPPEVWARGLPGDTAAVAAVRALLGEGERRKLRQLCGRTLYHGLQNVVVSHHAGLWTFCATGDLPLMWLRDSAVQIGVLLPRIRRRPSLRRVVEGGIRAQAFYILQDPYAAGFFSEWRHPKTLDIGTQREGRGGWVALRSYELDSGAYYLNLLWNYYQTPGLYHPEVLLEEPMVFDAAATMVRLWAAEQRHDESSPYRFAEAKCMCLANGGLGTPVNYTGMTWSGFRPSDDPNTFGYSIPSNIYAAGALQRALALNAAVWHSAEFEAAASKLLEDIEGGLAQHGTVQVAGGPIVYAYEVDGLGNSLSDFDDPNWPSLVAMPLLGYAKYDPEVYRATRARLLSSANKFWFEGEHFKGMGSPHTPAGMAWALGTLSEALTADCAEERVEKLRLLLKLGCGDGLMHESIDVNNPALCTRRWFEWANALSATAVEQLVGEDCDAAAEEEHRQRVAEREAQATGGGGAGGSGYEARTHQSLEAQMQWDGKYDSSKVDVYFGQATIGQRLGLERKADDERRSEENPKKNRG